LIALAFRPVRDESRVIVRGAYFRICADETLRGPDNAVVARHLNGLWQVLHGVHRSFECSGRVFLRVTNSDGTRRSGGPYELVTATRGAIFTNNDCVAIYGPQVEIGSSLARCREIALLSGL